MLVGGRSRRRTQRERSDATRGALLDAARRLFAERGFGGTPMELVVREAGVTSGALYHHFRDKRDLFRAAFDAVERSLAERVAGAAPGGGDPWRRLMSGVEEYLTACREAEVRRIVLLDGPSVLGWEEWHALDAAHHLRPLAGALAASMGAGRLARRPAIPLARVLMGALSEAGLAMDDPSEEEATRESVRWLLGRLAEPSSSGSGQDGGRSRRRQRRLR